MNSARSPHEFKTQLSARSRMSTNRHFSSHLQEIINSNKVTENGRKKEEKFYQGLRIADENFYCTNSKHPQHGVWVTVKPNRLNRH